VIDEGAHIAVGSELSPLEEALPLIMAEGGGMAVVLLLGIAALWRWASGLIVRLEARQEALLTRLVDEQAKAIGRVEVAISKLEAGYAPVIARLDRAETRLEDHGGRIVRLESAGESGIRRRRAAVSD
jgi:hypothetical protein